MGQEKKRCFFVINYLGSAAAGAGWIWARDIQGESVKSMIPGDGKLPVLLTLSLTVGIGVLIYDLVALISERRRKKFGSECCPDMVENRDTGFLEKQESVGRNENAPDPSDSDENKTASGRQPGCATAKSSAPMGLRRILFC